MGRHLATFATESLDVIKVGDKAAFQSKVCKSLTDCREFKKTNNVCTPREIAQVLYLVGPTWKDGHASRAVTAYIKSKALAERAAWDFIAKEGRHLELSVINPVGIFGPVLGQHYLTSITLVKRLMDGMPGCPRIHFGVVDVRDVADLHIRAMTGRQRRTLPRSCWKQHVDA